MKNFNQKIAEFVTNVTGNMWFFWAALFFVLYLRITMPPTATDFLLDVENDLQLLLLATAAVVSGKQQKHNDEMLMKIEDLEQTIAKQLENQMPIFKSASQGAVGRNYKAEVKAGKSKKQSLAIALSVQDRAKDKKSKPKKKK